MKPLALLFLCVFVVWARDEAARRLPTDAPLNDYETLEMGVEHTIDVQSEDNDYYLIRMPTKNQPLHLYITPCNRPVHWNLRIPNNFGNHLTFGFSSKVIEIYSPGTKCSPTIQTF